MNADPSSSAALSRAMVALEGLSIGDALGERFFGPEDTVMPRLAQRQLPAPLWPYTDDTAMALSVVEVLGRFGTIVSDELAAAFARRYRAEPARGYGAGAHTILAEMARGTPWRQAATGPFGGQGSFGNGGAMRVAPLGAFFADCQPEQIAREAEASAEVTHLHPEGRAGAVAIALAAAYSWRRRHRPELVAGLGLIDFVLPWVSAGAVRSGIETARSLESATTVSQAAGTLGTGQRVSAADTVPFCLWAAARHLDDFVEAFWNTVEGRGDRDTTAAIVCGIVASGTGIESIPVPWLKAREPLRLSI